MKPFALLLVAILAGCDASYQDANMSFQAMLSTCVDETITVRRVDDGDMRTLTITCKSGVKK